MEKFLIAGLGNPGARYARTRHNAGVDFVNELSVKWDLKFKEKKSIKSYLAQYVFKNKEIYLIKPIVFMNNSGNSLEPAIKKYNLNLANVLIVHDDLDLPSGSCKLKKSGGDGGHNGLKSIIESLGGEKDFLRMRIGISHPGKASLVNDYVVKKGTAKEVNERKKAIENGIEVVEDIIFDGWEFAINKLHSK